MTFRWIASAMALVFAVLAPVQVASAQGLDADRENPFKFKGSIVEIEWTNPIVWIHINVNDVDQEGKPKAGAVSRWVVATSTPNSMFKSGLTRETLVKGQSATFVGYHSTGRLYGKCSIHRKTKTNGCILVGRQMTNDENCTFFIGIAKAQLSTMTSTTSTAFGVTDDYETQGLGCH